MKRAWLLLLMLVFSIPAARAEEAPAAVEQARQSVVHLYGIGTDQETGKRTRWTGTGFAVGIAGEDTDIFLTNWHVATGSGEFSDDQVELWLLKDDAEFYADLTPRFGSAARCRVLITTDGCPDVAVVQALEPVTGYKALPLVPSRQVAEGTKVYALGFPGLKHTHGGADSGPEDVEISEGTVREHLVMKNAGDSKSIIHSAAIQHGFSGGPLVNQQGAVVAQNAYGFEEDVSTELFCAVYTDYGMELLNKLNIPFTTAQSPANPRRTAAAAVIGAGVLALIGYQIKSARKSWAEIKQARKEEASREN